MLLCPCNLDDYGGIIQRLSEIWPKMIGSRMFKLSLLRPLWNVPPGAPVRIDPLCMHWSSFQDINCRTHPAWSVWMSRLVSNSKTSSKKYHAIKITFRSTTFYNGLISRTVLVWCYTIKSLLYKIFSNYHNYLSLFWNQTRYSWCASQSTGV